MELERRSTPNEVRTAVSRWPKRLFFALIAVVLAVELIEAAARLDYLKLLIDAPDIYRRGYFAAEENFSPNATAGAVHWRRDIAALKAAHHPRPSAFALGWGFFARQGPTLKPGARIYLAVPRETLYYSGRYFFYPNPLEVAPNLSEPLTDDASLGRAALHASGDEAGRARLAGLGYAYAVAPAPRGLQLIPLSATPP